MIHSSTPGHKPPIQRWIENGHILLWLAKDICWVSEFKTGGIVMIFPTLAVALFITVRSWKVRAEAFHNVAICLWILGNSIWMTGEFFDKKWEPITIALFATGLAILLYYYLFLFRADRRTENVPDLKAEFIEAPRTPASA
jgi:hypothetical protein